MRLQLIHMKRCLDAPQIYQFPKTKTNIRRHPVSSHPAINWNIYVRADTNAFPSLGKALELAFLSTYSNSVNASEMRLCGPRLSAASYQLHLERVVLPRWLIGSGIGTFYKVWLACVDQTKDKER
jgi:hypothetical protein